MLPSADYTLIRNGEIDGRDGLEAVMREVDAHMPDGAVTSVLAATTTGMSGQRYWVGVGEHHLAQLRMRGGRAREVYRSRLVSPGRSTEGAGRDPEHLRDARGDLGRYEAPGVTR